MNWETTSEAKTWSCETNSRLLFLVNVSLNLSNTVRFYGSFLFISYFYNAVLYFIFQVIKF